MPKLSKADQRRKTSANEARCRKEVALARLREMEADEKAAKLIRADRVADRWVRIASAIKAGVLRMPDKLARQLAATGDPKEARAILAAEVETILKGLSDEVRLSATSR